MKLRLQPSTLDDGANRYNWLNFVQRLLNRGKRFSVVCRLCGAPAARLEICGACKDDLPWRVRPWQKRLAHVDGVSACFDFAYPIRQLVHRAKYRRDIPCARLLGELVAERWQITAGLAGSAALYPVPLARGRMLVRGFNQAVEISLPIMRQHGLLIDEVSIYKPLARKTQSTLDATNRRINTRDAFKWRREIQCDTAIVVDDVLTTGATVSAMARTLKAAGAARVLAWVVAAA